MIVVTAKITFKEGKLKEAESSERTDRENKSGGWLYRVQIIFKQAVFR